MAHPDGAFRTILHVDMDAFYVSVELRRRPELRGKPVVVGGTGNRGVIAAASYEARRFGVFSAMPSARARQLCPQAVFLPGDHTLYGEVSGQVHEIFQSVTPLVEGIALDEAFLDVSGALRLLGSGRHIADSVRRQVRETLALECSVGVAPNKFLAKLASKQAKPIADSRGVRPGAGVVEIEPGAELAFLRPLPVRALWGVGPKTHVRLERYGISTIGELADFGESALVTALGSSHGRHLAALAVGRDDRPVVPDREAKSIGHEETYPVDLFDQDELRAQVLRLSDAVSVRLRQHAVGARTITLKVRFGGFRTLTRSHTSPVALTTAAGVASIALNLLDGVDTAEGVRLLGVSGSNLEQPREQLALDLTGNAPVPTSPVRPAPATSAGTAANSAGRAANSAGRAANSAAAAPESAQRRSRRPSAAGEAAVAAERAWQDATVAIDQIRGRFGASAIAAASTVRRGRIRPVVAGAQQWGPDQLDPTDREPSQDPVESTERGSKRP